MVSNEDGALSKNAVVVDRPKEVTGVEADSQRREAEAAVGQG